MILFLDTEWADAFANEIVSLALVSDCGCFEFYAERDPLPVHSTDFVRTVVYPLLERGAYALADPEFTRSLHAFFGEAQRAARPDRIRIAYDHRNDLDLLGIALDAFGLPDTPLRPAFDDLPLMSLGAQYQQAVETLFASDPARSARRHHALVDARVNRDAWLACGSADGGAG